MSSTDTETQAAPTPVQQSNAAASLPGASGGASAAYGASSAPALASAPIAPMSEPYDTITTPTAVNVPNPRAKPALPAQTGAAASGASSDVIEYAMAGTRRMPVNDDLRPILATAAKAAGVDSVRIVSGGQPARGTSKARVGSTRHDLGGAADLQLIVGGRVLDFDDANDRPVFEKFISTAVGAGAQGVGAAENYMGRNTIHIGFGSPAAWGARGRVANAPAWLTAAWQTGLGSPVTVDENAVYAGDPFGVSAAREAPGAAQEMTVTPRLRGDVTTALAFGAQGARDGGMPEPLSTAALGATILDGGQFLQRGSRGAAAAEWQTFLNSQGFGLAVDGDFGRRTRAATKEWQASVQIEADGIVGPESLRAALFTIDPTAGPLSDGEVAYKSGAAAAAAIIAPAEAEQMRREVDMPSPRLRPERGAGIPNPRLRPGAATADLTPEQIDFLTETDAQGNYLRGPMAPRRERDLFGPAEAGQLTSDFRDKMMATGLEGAVLDETVTRFEGALKQSGRFRYASGQTPAEVGAIVSDFREKLLGQGMSGPVLDEAVRQYERAAKIMTLQSQRTSDASDAARGATRQRLSGMVPRTDRFRPRDSRAGGEVERIRTTEAVREYARGIADVYRRVADRRRTAVAASGDPDQQRFVTDALMRAAPTPAETVTETYAFRRRRVA